MRSAEREVLRTAPPGCIEDDPRAEFLFGDGIRWMKEAPPGSVDVIIVDSTDPKGPGVGLFLEPFYEKVARALKPGGVMVAQTESPHWDAPMVGAIYDQLRQAFPDYAAYAARTKRLVPWVF